MRPEATWWGQALILIRTEDWQKSDAMIEVEDQKNAVAIFNHFNNTGINMFSQKITWHPVKEVSDMPANYKGGSLFVTTKSDTP